MNYSMLSAVSAARVMPKKGGRKPASKMAAATNVQILKSLLLEEIERIVADAKDAHSVVLVGYHAGHLLRTYPETGFTRDRIVHEITTIAAMAKVPIESNRAE